MMLCFLVRLKDHLINYNVPGLGLQELGGLGLEKIDRTDVDDSSNERFWCIY